MKKDNFNKWSDRFSCYICHFYNLISEILNLWIFLKLPTALSYVLYHHCFHTQRKLYFVFIWKVFFSDLFNLNFETCTLYVCHPHALHKTNLTKIACTFNASVEWYILLLKCFWINFLTFCWKNNIFESNGTYNQFWNFFDFFILSLQWLCRGCTFWTNKLKTKLTEDIQGFQRFLKDCSILGDSLNLGIVSVNINY